MTNQITITGNELRALGYELNRPAYFNSLDEYKKFLPTIVVARSLKNFIMQDADSKFSFAANAKYVMDIRQYGFLYNNNNNRFLEPADIQFKDIYKPYDGQDLTDKKILIWGAGGFGDLLFIQPSLIYLKEKYPTSQIFLSCKHNRKSLVKNWDCVDAIVDNPFHYDFVTDMDYQVFFQDMPSIIRQFNQENIYKLFAKWMGLNLADEILIPKLKPEPEKLIKCEEVLSKWGLEKNSFIILQTDASCKARVPGINVWQNLINALTLKGHKILISGMPNNAVYINNFISTLRNPEKVYNFAAFSEDITDLIAITSLSKIAVSPDSALIHIAAGLGIKAFGIYGAFTGNIRLSTYKNCDWSDCKSLCSPCFIHEYSLCKNVLNNYPDCYNNLNIQETLQKIEKLLKTED